MERPEDKTCARCGRRIAWRAAWKDDWDAVRWCSQACRRRKLRAPDRAAEARLHAELAAVGRGRLVAVEAVGDEDRETVRCAARRLVAAGLAEAVQGGRVVDVSTAKGDFALRAR